MELVMRLLSLQCNHFFPNRHTLLHLNTASQVFVHSGTLYLSYLPK